LLGEKCFVITSCTKSNAHQGREIVRSDINPLVQYQHNKPLHERTNEAEKSLLKILLYTGTAPGRITKASSAVISNMIGTSIYDYIFIRFCIFVLHWIAPLSILYCLSSLVYPTSFHVSRILQVWATLETAFYLLVYHPRKIYLQKAATNPTPICHEQRRVLFQRCHKNIPDPERYLAKWFMNAPASEIKRENVKDFFRWAFLNKGVPDTVDDEELEDYIREREKLLGREIKPGRGNAECFRLTLGKVDMLHRSLTWYLVSFYRKMHTNSSFHDTSHIANFTSSYSVCLSSTQQRLPTCATTPSTSTGLLSFDFPQSFPSAPLRFSPRITPPRTLSLIGIVHTLPKPDSLFYLSTVLALGSTHT
jgi:hypothetical protein